MRKIIVFNLVSVDGYFAGVDGNIDWHNVDDEFNKFAVEQTQAIDTIIFGRTTYQIFEEFWPKALIAPETSDDDRKVAQAIDDAEKIVFSKTLKDVTWKNTKLLHEIHPGEIDELKQQPGGDMVILGSGTIVQQFTNFGLIDEYRLLVNPIILGHGRPMFESIKEKLTLKLLNTRSFANGNIMLYYSAL